MSDGAFDLTNRREWTERGKVDKRLEKYKKQRLKRGWADCDTWALDSWMLSVLPGMLRCMADDGSGYAEYVIIDGKRQPMTARTYRRWLHRLAHMLTEGHKLIKTIDDPKKSAVGQRMIESAMAQIAANISKLWW